MAVPSVKASDIARWIEPVPHFAKVAWCLPAFGGRVLIRGYDTHRSRLTDLDQPRWGLDETLVPLTAVTAKKTDGPAGELHPGDCVIFVGNSSDSPEPFVWFPQRIVHVDDGPSGWQRVWAIRDCDREQDGRPVIEPGRIPPHLLTADPLHGNDRRLVLEWFGLNVECAFCASHGEQIWFGPPIDPMWGHYGGERYQEGDDAYACSCGARWHVTSEGQLVFRPPMPIM